ncbi:MAG: hypothetical protein A4E73_02408 [Syntrophaceae bacterium PtaU1.Bin231]|nr:MAG: hypothetical protein A4E73_02408 [Syntrophaceae bacterium PtaU1.Bin231]OQB40338.1 MAG: hypothetical protein BWY06_01227 [Candidatus Latescibacteria bacterium ADurb.Bin168]
MKRKDSAKSGKIALGLDRSPCKADEIEFLGRLVDFFSDSNAYLKNIFTDELLKWFKREIESDMSCDVMAEVDFFRTEMQKNFAEAMSLTSKLSDAKNEIQSLIRQNSAMATTLSEQAAELHDLRETKISYEVLEKQYSLLIEARNAALGRIDELTTAVEELHSKVLDKDSEILRLKAKLFDILDGKGIEEPAGATVTQ